jgi:hypothetical protein
MLISLLFLVLFEPQQLEQQMLRQQQQLEQLSRQLDQQRQQLDRILGVLEEQSQARRSEQKAQPLCSVEVLRANGADVRKVPLNVAAVVPLNLFSTVSRPTDGCLPAEVRITASYMDASDNLICSGTIDVIAIQNNLTQSINFDIRPWNLREFVRWRNEPSQVNSGAKRLVCMNPEGTAETTSEEMDRAASTRVRATVLAAGGGMSTAEIQLGLR